MKSKCKGYTLNIDGFVVYTDWRGKRRREKKRQKNHENDTHKKFMEKMKED